MIYTTVELTKNGETIVRSSKPKGFPFAVMVLHRCNEISTFNTVKASRELVVESLEQAADACAFVVMELDWDNYSVLEDKQS